jgi:hypothetical protein
VTEVLDGIVDRSEAASTGFARRLRLLDPASVRSCHAAFSAPGVLTRVLDYPLGLVAGAQALAVRTADTVVHTWGSGWVGSW